MIKDPNAVLASLIERRFRELARPCLVGICGAQGSGKSTSTRAIEDLLESRGRSVAAFSLDDLYLTHAERLALGSTVHPLLRTRGPPGTHDIQLGLNTIAHLLAGQPVSLPSFDKAIDDRRPAADWKRLDHRVDVVILEGWCVGGRPQSEAQLTEPINLLEASEDPTGVWRRFSNAALWRYQALFDKIDFLILLAAPSFDVVADWRHEQELSLEAESYGREGGDRKFMSKADVERFVQHYERLTREVLDEMPARADVVVQLDDQRHCVNLVSRSL